ncbi:hypothetical protein IWZ03DRAFT_385485 [Phyllosticta citriasiana]|uniref:Secreted protein n=1 Tax=Phyllosticta citriasiana TaxID=595635 RepID=A0ABR1KEP0_9PEZI
MPCHAFLFRPTLFLDAVGGWVGGRVDRSASPSFALLLGIARVHLSVFQCMRAFIHALVIACLACTRRLDLAFAFEKESM